MKVKLKGKIFSDYLALLIQAKKEETQMLRFEPYCVSKGFIQTGEQINYQELDSQNNLADDSSDEEDYNDIHKLQMEIVRQNYSIYSPNATICRPIASSTPKFLSF